MEFGVLGPLQVTDGDRAITISSRRQRALLALLLVHANRTVSTERVLDELWGAEAPESGREAVAFHVSRLRRTLGEGADGAGLLRTRDGGYALATAPETIDAVRFERLAGEAHQVLRADPAAAAQRLAAALEVWRGEPYEGLADLPFAAEEVRRLSDLLVRATEDRLEAEIILGHHARVLVELEALVDREPLREHIRGLFMLALYRSGRQADALNVYQVGRRILAEELGIDPSPELTALQTAILRQDPALLFGGPVSLGGIPAAEARNPYKGLRAFEEADAADFFGREALTARLVAKLGEVARGGGLLAVVGPSGSGKSSVVRAGLVPVVRAGALPGSAGWTIATMLPGARPVDELAASLRSAAGTIATAIPWAGWIDAVPTALAAAVPTLAPPAGRLVIVIDQLEELWTVAPAEERDRFLSVILGALAMAPGRLLVVATLRADHLDTLLRSPEIGRLLRDGTELVPALRREELERAIEQPAAGAGLAIEPGLVERIAADVADRPAMLPLLQYALTELADRAGSGRLDRSGYEAIGGVLGALAGRAEATYEALGPAEREAARQVFLRLVAVEPTGEAGGRRAPRSAFDESSVEWAVIERFARARLLAHGRDARSGEPMVEIAHEALLTRWPRLAAWVEGEREALWMRRRLAEATAEWLEHGRDVGFVLVGSRLEMFASWVATTDLRIGLEERAFLEAGLAERRRGEEADAARRTEQRRLERRGTRWLTAAVVVFAAAAIVSTALLAAVWRQAEEAAENEAIATARELAVAANGRLEADPGLAALLAIESARATAHRGWITEETMDALHWAIQALRVPYPTREIPVAVRAGPVGPRGVYLVPPVELVGLAERVRTWRKLSPDECRTHLRAALCPPTYLGLPKDLSGVMTAAGVVPVERLDGTGTAGSSVRVLNQLPVDATEVLTGYAAATRTTVVVLNENDGVVVSDDNDGSALARAVAKADVAILARPGDVAEIARTQLLVDLRTILRPEELDAIAASPLADLGWAGTVAQGRASDGARLVGVPIAATASSLIWYSADAFAAAGYAPPATRSELEDLVDAMLAVGRTPWCVGLAGGTAGVDWVEDLAIQAWGGSPPASAWSRWLRLESASIADVLLRFQRLVASDGAVFGGPGTAVGTPANAAAAQMGSEAEPECWLIHAGAGEQVAWEGVARPDLRPILLPLDDGRAAVRGRVYTLVVVRDRPEVRALVRDILGPGVAATLAGLEPASGIVPLGPSGETAGRADAETVRSALAGAIAAGRFWLDASDRMPRELGEEALPAAVVRIVEAPSGMAELQIEVEREQLARFRDP